MLRRIRLLAAVLVAATVLAGVTRADGRAVRVGVVQDGDWALLEQLGRDIRQELEVLVEGEFTVVWPADAQRNGGWDLTLIDAQFRELLRDDDVDVVIALGLAASQIACNERVGYPKPVIAPLSLEIEIQDLPRAGLGSGVPNLTYVAVPGTLRDELLAFRELVPFRRIALVTNVEVLAAMPQIEERTLAQLAALDLEAPYVAAGDTAASVLNDLPDDVDAVYVWPLLLDAGETERLFEGLAARGLPSLSGLGRVHVEAGALATFKPGAARRRLARRVALDVQQILLGIPAAEIDVDFESASRLLLNMATARRIGLVPRYEVVLEAEVIRDDAAAGLPELTMSGAVDRAVAANLALAAERVTIDIGLENLRTARSAFRPTLDAGVTGLLIDDDRAAAAAGTAPERSLTGGLTATQLVYSDTAAAGVRIERESQRAREASLEELRLDVALDAAVSFLELLRAETAVAVRRANLELTRSNLELARSRRRIGTAGRAETLRWESQIANDRGALVAADAQRQTARVALNRRMHESLEAEYRAVDVALDDPTFSPGSGVLDGYIETPLHYAAFRDFVAERGVAAAPEVRSVDAALAAQRRGLVAARRSYWAPTVAAQATLDEAVAESGAGSGVALPGGPDDTDWSIALNLTLPLWSGGARKAERRRGDFQVRQLELQRAAAVEGVEAAIRVAMIDAGASYTRIRLARAAARAARENLELVQDAYARGALPIIDLIDAQNAALSADLGSNDAVYDFFIDLMRVQRAANSFDFFVSREARAAWAEDVRAYFAERGIEPWGVAP